MTTAATAPSILRIHPADDLIVALRPLQAGEQVSLDGQSWILRHKVGAKHKFAARDFAKDALVTLYGVTVGRAKVAIAAGELVHTHNLQHATAGFSGKQRDTAWTPPTLSNWSRTTFNGYKRPGTRAGTANCWLVIPLVFCENRNLAFMKEALQKALAMAALAHMNIMLVNSSACISAAPPVRRSRNQPLPLAPAPILPCLSFLTWMG
nr:SAF domain-containing protein [Verrucomicrobium spinosum]